MSAVLLTRLKITDLSAWTALEAASRLLPPEITLARIVREQLYLFEPEPGGAAETFEPALADAVRHSNFFVNPNKESYRFLTASGRGEAWVPPEGAWGILSRAREETRDRGLLERLMREHPLRGLGAIRRAKAWWLWTRGPDEGCESDRSAAALGVLEGPRRGLLVNPHSEACIVISGPTPWGRIESFLTEPAPAHRAAA